MASTSNRQNPASLFIGGPMDGQLMVVPTGRTRHKCRKWVNGTPMINTSPFSIPDVKIIDYTLQTITHRDYTGTHVFYAFVREGMDEQNWIPRMEHECKEWLTAKAAPVVPPPAQPTPKRQPPPKPVIVKDDAEVKRLKVMVNSLKSERDTALARASALASKSDLPPSDMSRGLILDLIGMLEVRGVSVPEDVKQEVKTALTPTQHGKEADERARE